MYIAQILQPLGKDTIPRGNPWHTTHYMVQ